MEVKNGASRDFQVLMHKERRVILEYLGTPAISYPSLVVYRKNNLWLVLFFRDKNYDGRLASELWAAAFFDEKLNLLWSEGLKVMPRESVRSLEKYRSVSKVAEDFGLCHGRVGSGKTVLQYLTDGGQVVFIQCEGDVVVNISHPTLSEIESAFT